MKISQIKISNISTFPFIRHFSDKQWVIFDAREKMNFNVLIWPNWSWKSTFLNIINQIFNVWLIKQYNYDREILDAKSKKRYKEVITEQKIEPKKFYKHFQSTSKLSKIAISLKLNQYDIENIEFITKNYEILNEILKKYSTLDIEFYGYNSKNLWFNNEIYLELELNTKDWKISILNQDTLNNNMKYVLFYIQHMELVQICINIYNDYIRKHHEKKLYSLKNTFAFLKSERPFLYLHNNDNPLIIDSIWKRSHHIDQNKSSSVSVWYDLFVIKLLKKIKEEINSSWKNANEITIAEKVEILKNTKIYNEISWYIHELLWLNIDTVIWLDERIFFVFKKPEWVTLTFDKLSSWEKSVVMMIFSMLWYDLSNWLFVIDEPELHLHPYMLKTLINTLKKIWSKLNIQFICATHSPLLIDEQSIHNVYKFSLINWKTIINYPVDWIRDAEATLIHILKFENVSKIFFIDKIIMVEWETDEYFRKYYLNYLSKQPGKENFIKNYEILNINWKWSYKKWTRFLNKFGIKWYFIWDRDNTIENNIIAPEEMSEYIKLTKSHMNSNHINKWKFYTRIISTIKKFYPDRFKYIISKIKSFYRIWIFIMKRWDLESYLWLEKKWLEPTIHFCNRQFHYRLTDERHREYKEEFEEISNMIFEIEKTN